MDAQQFLLMRLESGNLSDIKNALKTFIEANSDSFTFPTLDRDKLDKLYSLVFNILCNPMYSECYIDCLSCLKLLFRDSKYLDELISQERFNILLQTARLYNTQPTVCYSDLSASDFDVMLEAEKSLCNLIYNSKQAQQMCVYTRSNILQSIIYRLRTYSDPHLPYQVKLFDMKLLFLITAFCQEVRLHVKEEQHGVTYLIEILDLILKQAASENKSLQPHVVLNEEQVLLLAEVLKTLFNLLCKYSMSQPMDEDDPLSHRLVSFLRDLMLCEVKPSTRVGLLRTHVINLLTAVPPSSLEQLGSGAGEGESHNADALLTIITYLHEELASRVPSPGTTPTSSSGTVDHILPVLHVLSEAARHHKALRRLIRNQILPARRDFSSRPEEGDSLLSHLTRCLSSGMLAARGLLGCQNKGQYSSSSEESDTEEYLRVKDNINPVTGVYEPPKPDSTQVSLTSAYSETVQA
ncbi:hypothetical protein M8J75_004272 [Diaphorina citri]|nr:hypothetical protein M8J75_004272 [Diaphorina citri]